MGLSNSSRVRRSHIYWHLIFFGLVLGVVFVAIRGLKEVITPLAASLLLSYLLDPAVSWVHRRLRLPRWIATLVLFFAVLLALAAVLLMVLPVIIRELQAFAEAVPGYVSTIRTTTISWVEATFHVRFPTSLSELADRFGSHLREMASRSLAPLGGMAGKVADEAAAAISALIQLLLVPVFTFFFSLKLPRIIQGLEALIPRRYLAKVQVTAQDVDRTLAAWLRGQLTVVTALAALYSVGLSIIGIKMAVLIGVLTGLLAFIPYVGMTIGLSIAVLVTLLESHGWGQLLGVGVVFAVVQIIDGIFLTPVIVGERAGIGPLGVLIALLVGGNLFGFVGVLLAVPTAATLTVVLRHVLATYTQSTFYLRSREGEVPSDASASASAAGDEDPQQ